MAKLLSYPHYRINVDDQSSYDGAVVFEFMPLHVPMFFCTAASGDPNIPKWYPNWNSVTRSLGKETFDRLTKYFTRDGLFIEENFKEQGAFIVRLVPEDSATASCLIEAHVEEDIDVIQYERDVFGGFVLNTLGEPIVMLDSTNQPIVEKGTRITWKTRTIDPILESDIRELKPKTVSTGSSTKTIFPIFAAIDTSPGEAGNRKGFKFYFSFVDQQNSRLQNNQALEFQFVPINRNYTSDIPLPVRNRWNQVYSSFMLKPNQVDGKLMMKISYDDVLENNYVKDAASELPFDFHVFTDYIKIVSDKVASTEKAFDNKLTDGWMIDIFSAKDLNGNPYKTLILNTYDCIFFNRNYNIYLEGGSDGSIDAEHMEDMMRQFLECKIYREVIDPARYPITHLYDTGYSMKTKEAMIAFLGTREDVRVEIATQDCNYKLNSEDEDLASGLYLRNRALLQVESALYSTNCFRCGVYCHAGPINDSTYKGFIPTTFDILKKRTYYQSSTYISGEPKGLPYSEVNVFKRLNWVAFDESNKQLFWDTGLNYVQYYDRVSLHWPDIRTVYTNDTSVLSETTYADAVVYCKHMIRRTWATFTGRSDPSHELFPMIEKSMSDKIQAAFAGRYPFSVKAWQTDEERKLGYITHLTLRLTGRNGNRVHDADIICLRENYTRGE